MRFLLNHKVDVILIALSIYLITDIIVISYKNHQNGKS